MNKNSILTERQKLRSEIKDLLNQYDTLKHKDEPLEVVGSAKEEKMFDVMNSIAMKYAREGYVDRAEKWLKKVEPLTKKNARFSVIFHSNLACVFKQKDDLPKALSHLKQSQEIIKKARLSQTSKRLDRMLIDCWLNMAALLSSKSMHEQALQNIASAQILILTNLDKGYQQFVDQFIVAKYNQVIQYEHLERMQESYECVDWLRKYMYQEKVFGHFLEKKINDVYHDLRKKVVEVNKSKKRLSQVTSLSKLPLRESINKHQVISIHDNRRKSTLKSKNVNKLATLLDSKQNHYQSTFSPITLQPRPQKHRLSVKTSEKTSHQTSRQPSPLSTMRQLLINK